MILASPQVDYHCYESKWYIALVPELVLTVLTASFTTLVSLPAMVEGTGDVPKDDPKAAPTRKPSRAKATKGKAKGKAKGRNKRQRMESPDILIPENVGSEVMSRDAFVAWLEQGQGTLGMSLGIIQGPPLLMTVRRAVRALAIDSLDVDTGFNIPAGLGYHSWALPSNTNAWSIWSASASFHYRHTFSCIRPTCVCPRHPKDWADSSEQEQSYAHNVIPC